MRYTLINIFLLTLVFTTGCMTKEKEKCTNYGEELFTKALILKLDKEKFVYRINSDGFICVTETKEKEIRKIVNTVDHYFRGLATILTTQNDKENVIKWLNTNKIPYEISTHPKGDFIVIYSMTEEKASSNKFKLDEILHNF